MVLNPGSPVPLYYQLANILIDKIRSGEYPEETRIPSENELSKEYNDELSNVSQQNVSLTFDIKNLNKEINERDQSILKQIDIVKEKQAAITLCAEKIKSKDTRIRELNRDIDKLSKEQAELEEVEAGLKNQEKKPSIGLFLNMRLDYSRVM